jgi:uncharacterized membrane protein YoaT (DUF817 family)
VPIDLTYEWIGAFFATTENTGGWMYIWSYSYVIQQLHFTHALQFTFSVSLFIIVNVRDSLVRTFSSVRFFK